MALDLSLAALQLPWAVQQEVADTVLVTHTLPPGEFVAPFPAVPPS